MNLPIAHSILNPDGVTEYMKDAQELGSFGHKGLTITLFKNDEIEALNTDGIVCLVARIEGLGHKVHMMYVFDDPEAAGMPVSDVGTFFKDFQHYVMLECESTNATKH